MKNPIVSNCKHNYNYDYKYTNFCYYVGTWVAVQTL